MPETHQSSKRACVVSSESEDNNLSPSSGPSIAKKTRSSTLSEDMLDSRSEINLASDNLSDDPDEVELHMYINYSICLDFISNNF